MFYDREGNLIDAVKFTELYQTDNYRCIGLDTDGTLTVSTVWLGVNYNFTHSGVPAIFETMVFHRDTGFSGLYCARYETEKEAIEGHSVARELSGLISL